MTNSYEINNLNFLAVLDKLHIDYSRAWINLYKLHENWRMTDGWILNVTENKINDFSWKERPKWPPFAFVKQRLGCTDAETYKWFADKFGIDHKTIKAPTKKKEATKKKTTTAKQVKQIQPVVKSKSVEQKPTSSRPKIDIKKAWSELPDLTKEQIEYLHSRCIDYKLIKNVVKSYEGWIWCIVYENGLPVWVNTRLINNSKTRFLAMKGWSWKGLYMTDLDETNKTVYVVEWLIDFLTLKQFTKNVVWLRSAADGLWEITALSKKYDIILIPDTDEAGQKAMYTLSQMWCLFKFVQLPTKDINDFVCEIAAKEWAVEWDDVLTYLKENAIDSVNILPQLTEISPFTWGLDWMNDRFWKFYPWDFTVILGESWHWKTEFALFQAIENAKRWNKVSFISLEMTPDNLVDRLCKRKADITIVEDNTKNIPEHKMRKYAEHRYTLLQNPNLDFTAPRQNTVADIVNFIKEKHKQWYTLFYLDNFGFVTSDAAKNETEIMTELSRELKQLCNEIWVAIFWLHHFTKWNQKQRVWVRWLAAIRWSWKIENDIDYGLIVYRDTIDVEDWISEDNEAKLIIAKNRRNWIVWSFDVLFEGWEYIEDE